MIFELRVILGALVAFAASLALVFFQWEFVFPAFALAYLGYKYYYYRKRIGQYTNWSSEGAGVQADGGRRQSNGSHGQGDPAAAGQGPAQHGGGREQAQAGGSPGRTGDGTLSTGGDLPGRLLEKTLLLFFVLLLVTRLFVFPLIPNIWSVGTLSPPVLDLSDLGVLLNQITPIVTAWGTLLLPLAVLSYAVGQFRLRLRAGTDSREAAVRAALWESFARVPIYLLWSGILVLGPVYEHWVGVPQAIATGAGVTIPAAAGFSPVLPNVFPVLVGIGHIVPLLVVGSYMLVRYEKYDDMTVPEVLGYHGFYPPDQLASRANRALPAVLVVLYSAAVVLFNPSGPQIGAIPILPALVAIIASADVRGLTSQLSQHVPDWLPGMRGDPILVGFNAGLYTIGLLSVVGAVVPIGLPLDHVAALYYPILALPLGFGANWAVALQKSGSIERMVERVERNPGSIDQSDIDRLLAYADARKERLRGTAIDGLATAVWASSYRQGDIIAVFEDALESGDEQYMRPGLRGIVMLFRRQPSVDVIGRLTQPAIVDQIVATMDHPDVQTRALAAEAFCRIVDAGYRTGHSQHALANLDRIPIGQIEEIVLGEGANQDLTDAAVACFARLWDDRADGLAGTLGEEDRQSVLVDLVWWAGFATDQPRAKAAFAVTNSPAVVGPTQLDSIREYLENDVGLVRLMAAHVLRSSMAELADRIDPDELLPLLEDSHEQARWAGGEAIYAYVEATEAGEAVLADLLAHLEACDPETAGAAEATVLETLTLVDEATLAAESDVATTVAAYVTSENGAVAEPAARLLATFVAANPDKRHDETVRGAIESGLTHENTAVREHCVRTAANVVEVAPGDGRPFIRGLVLNLGTAGTISEVAVSALDRVLADYPEYGTEFLPEFVGGLRNPSTISKQYAGAMLVGRSVSQVTATLLASITDHDVSRGDILIGPLVDLAGNADAAREAIFKTLANLSLEYPDEARDALSAAGAALDEGSVRVRRNAAQVLSNVALEHPEAIAPFVSSLMIATDDSDPQTRSIALVTIGTVGASTPDAIESDIRRVIGRLEDDSSMVREHAAKAIITISEHHPDIVEPTAEASDRLRRLQRDPAVDLDEDLLQEAANAIRTGTPPGQAVDSGDDTDIFTPESADEVGQSGDTRVFDPSDAALEDAADEEQDDEGEGGT